jgi:glycosyltransferase 2 family protein
LARIPRSLKTAGQWLLGAAILFFVIRHIATDWPSVSERLRTHEFGYGWIALSGAIFLATYALLIETWRRVVAVWGESLPWTAAARIWLVSNLGKYLPGKIWAITAMALMARRAGVSPVAATGSAIVMQLVSISAGVLVVALTGAAVLHRYAWAFGGLALFITIGLLLGPQLLRFALGQVARFTGRAVGEVPDLPLRTILLAAAGNSLAWIAYGLAFRALSVGILGKHAPGDVALHISIYTFSYIGGLVVPTPGGLGVREALLMEGLRSIDYLPVNAAFVAVTSRIWLTLLEVVPGLVYYFSPTGGRTRP